MNAFETFNNIYYMGLSEAVDKKETESSWKLQNYPTFNCNNKIFNVIF